jgi:hypothetical protein
MVQGGGVGLSKDFQRLEPKEDDCIQVANF